MTDKEAGEIKAIVSFMRTYMLKFPTRVPEKIIGWEPTRSFLPGQDPIMAPVQKRWSYTSVNKFLSEQKRILDMCLHQMAYILADDTLPEDVVRTGEKKK